MRPFAAACLLLIFAAPARGQFRAFASADRINPKLAGHVDDYTRSLFHDRRIESPILGQPRDLYVYLPPGYDPRKSYPVLYYFHVSRVDESEFVGSGRLLELDRMIVAGEFPPTVVVCPDGTIHGRNRLNQPHSFYVNGVNGRFADHIVDEVIPFVTARYSIRPERQAHAILGVSSGGLGALSIAIRHRAYFGAVATLAAPANLVYDNCRHDQFEDFSPATYREKPAYDPDEVIGRFYLGLSRVRARRAIRPIFGDEPEEVAARIRAVNPASLIASTNLAPCELAIYLNYGGRDGYNFDAQNESFAWLAAQRGVAVTLEVDPPANHTLAYFRRNHRAAFAWLSRQLLPPT